MSQTFDPQFVSSSKFQHDRSSAKTGWEIGPLESVGSLDSDGSAAVPQPRRKSGSLKNKLISRLANLKDGSISITDGDELFQLGDRNAANGLSTELLVSDPTFYRRILFGGTMGSAETYMDGLWSCSDLTSLIRIMIRNIEDVSRLNTAVSALRNITWRLKHSARKNSVQGSKRNIVEHYDLGNDFYKLFLDPTMNYSSGIFDARYAAENFPSVADEMHAASLTKMDRICRKLELKPDDSVLEIGTGWGAMAVHIASHYGCNVTTTTISEEQYRLACQRVEAAGMEHQITVLKQDYRTLTGQFDKIVSIEMVEAVGHRFMKQFFRKCCDLLRPHGVMLIQAITMSQQNYRQYLQSVDFIRAYIFPGGCLPTVGSLQQASADASDMRMLHMEDITPHYAATLRHWKDAFLTRLNGVRELGYDERLIRMWNFYLSYCEAGFEERRVHCTQLIFARPDSPIDLSTSTAVPRVS